VALFEDVSRELAIGFAQASEFTKIKRFTKTTRAFRRWMSRASQTLAVSCVGPAACVHRRLARDVYGTERILWERNYRVIWQPARAAGLYSRGDLSIQG
jgi:hypothetical protein